MLYRHLYVTLIIQYYNLVEILLFSLILRTNPMLCRSKDSIVDKYKYFLVKRIRIL